MTEMMKKQDNDKISVIGIVSFAAVVHSHLYWVYSIIYIAYYKMQSPKNTHRRSTTTKVVEKKKPKKRHVKKKSFIIPSIKTAKEKEPYQQQCLPYRTLPSTSSFNIHQLIQSHRTKKKISLDELQYTSSTESLPSITMKKKDRAFNLLRSTFNKKQQSENDITLSSPKNAILSLTKKLSVKERPKLSLRTFSWKRNNV